MKIVYELRRQLADDPQHVADVQALTLNKDKPLLGLKGARGLFGSEEWWRNIERGKLKTRRRYGIIGELIFAGQDARWGDQVNSFRLDSGDGTSELMSMRMHDKIDLKLFRVGATVEAVYVLDELKGSTRWLGKKNYAEILLEMAITADW